MKTAIKLNEGNSKEYEIEAICDSEIYTKKSDSSHLPGLYYLVSWKNYFKEENIWKPALMVLHLSKLISTFHYDHPERPTSTSTPIDSAPPMARPIVKLKAEASSIKQKQKRPAKNSGTNKQAKKSWTSSFLPCFWPCLNSRQTIPPVTWPMLRSALLRSLIFQFLPLFDFHPAFGFSS